MSLLTFINFFKSNSLPNTIQNIFARYGHQMCTRNRCRRNRPKRRGWKIFGGKNARIHDAIITQKNLVFHPGMNVELTENYTLHALVDGKIKVSCEVFDPDFNHKANIRFYDHRRGQKMYKKYINVIPKPQHTRFRLVDVV